MALASEQNPWMDSARCFGADPNLFIPGRGQSIEPALAICNGGSFVDRRSHEVITYLGECPVKQDCGAYQRVENEQGVWGGEFFPTKDWKDPHEVSEVVVSITLQDARPRSVND